MTHLPSDQKPSFRSSVLKGVSWSTLANVTSQAVNFSTFAILGKFYLTPADFGLVAMIMVITGFASLFTEFGLGAALIQNQGIGESHKSSVFWLNLVLGSVIAIAISLSGTLIADFYNRPALISMVSPLALTLVLAAGTSVQVALLKKELKFRSIAIVSMAADLTSMIVAIASAAIGFGVWALVLKVLVLRTIFLAGSWIASQWRPRFTFCIASLKEVLGFGASFFSTSMLIYITAKLSELVVGKFAGDSALGLYSNASKIVVAPIGLIKNQIVGVFFPAFSSIQDDLPRVRSITLKLSALLAWIGFSALFLLIALSSSLVDCFLSAQWSGMKQMLVLLSCVGIFEISVFPGTILLSQGLPSKYFKLMLYIKAISMTGIVIGVITYGVTGMLIGMLIAAMINFLPQMIFIKDAIQLDVLQQLRANSLPFIMAAIAATAVYTMNYTFMNELSPSIKILLQTIFFVSTLLFLAIVFRPFPFDKPLRLKDLV